jgi:membrane fusion protein, multidrug efflux system
MTASRILRWPILLSCCLGLGYPITGCSSSETTASGGSRRSQTLAVATTAVTARDLARSVTVTGALEPIRTVSVNSQITATLLNVLVEEGSRVRTGQLLAELDARESAAQLARARAVLVNAEAAYERARRLQASAVVSESEIDVLRSAYEIARADVELWSTRVAFARIVAPVDGIVTVKRVEQGGSVSANQALFEIAEDDRLVVRVRVSELDVVFLEAGRPVTVRLDAYPDVRVPARIRRIFPSADATSWLVPVEVELESVPAGIAARPGFLARLEFALDRRDSVLTVPNQAIGVNDQGAFVYVVEADTLSRRAVTTGLTTEGLVEVVAGLRPGESVVVSGHSNLRPGATVRVTSADDPGGAR